MQCQIMYSISFKTRIKEEKLMYTQRNNDAILTGRSQRQIALVAGFGLLLMIVFIMLAELLAMANIIVPGDAAATTNNITAHESRFRMGVFFYLIVVILDFVVAWALYVFLKPLNNSLSMLAAWSRLAYATLFGVALVNYYGVVQLLSNADKVSAFQPTELHTQVMLSLNAFHNVWDVGFIFFGLHLVFLGVVVFKSSSIPRWLGILVVISGISYLIDYFGKILFINFNPNVSLIFGWGEAIFMIWLIFWGGKQPKTSQIKLGGLITSERMPN
jgi:hypothetical protein